MGQITMMMMMMMYVELTADVDGSIVNVIADVVRTTTLVQAHISNCHVTDDQLRTSRDDILDPDPPVFLTSRTRAVYVTLGTPIVDGPVVTFGTANRRRSAVPNARDHSIQGHCSHLVLYIQRHIFRA